jgi:syntaxin 5
VCCRAGFRPRANGTASSQHSEFAKRASRIGLGIHSTSQKLAKLAQLAKRTSMFDDPAAEINELTGGSPQGEAMVVTSALRSARLPVNLIGSPISYANRLIGSPITSQSTGHDDESLEKVEYVVSGLRFRARGKPAGKVW